MMLWYRGLYDWVLRWAARPPALAALFLLALAESSFFPIPPDVLLVAIVLAEPRRAWRATAACTAGSILGGAAGYVIGWAFWEMAGGFFYHWVPGITPELYARVAGLYDRHDFWVVFVAGLTPIPYKVFTITAGVSKISFPIFVLASTLSRGARFLLEAALLHRYGAPIRRFVERWLGWLMFLLVLLVLLGLAALSRLS
ncbi:MAG: YqaA family protein [Acidobacteriota bacterium]